MGSASMQSVQSIDRVLDIIELLSAHPYGLTLSEIAGKSQLHTSTVHRLLATLVRRGYITKVVSKYKLTLRLFEMGSRLVDSSGVLSVARPLIDHMASVTSGITVHLVLWENIWVTYLYKSELTQNHTNMGSYVGLHNPMYCTGVGKSILALLPHEKVENIWDKTEIVKQTATTIVTLEDMYAELEIVRNQGYAFDNEENEIGIGCVAVGVRNYEGEPIGAVSISGLIHRVQDNRPELIRKVKSLANEISRQLGCIPPSLF